jgi:metallo-beta-lactamase class B
MPVQDGGRTYNVVFACSLRAPGTIPPEVAAEFVRTFPKFRALPCDVPLGDHPAQYNMIEKHAKLAAGGPNPFIDPQNCLGEADVQEAMYKATLAEQQGAAKK